MLDPLPMAAKDEVPSVRSYVGLAPFSRHPGGSLSHGQEKQCLANLPALCQAPEDCCFSMEPVWLASPDARQPYAQLEFESNHWPVIHTVVVIEMTWRVHQRSQTFDVDSLPPRPTSHRSVPLMKARRPRVIEKSISGTTED